MIEKFIGSNYNNLVEIWESSVKYTHNFLKKEDFIKIKKDIESILKSLLIYTNSFDNKIVCFAGISGDNLEALFCHRDYVGKGYGRELLDYTVNILKVRNVDVNAENISAYEFYKKAGFIDTGISYIDSYGYKIIKMSLR